MGAHLGRSALQVLAIAHGDRLVDEHLEVQAPSSAWWRATVAYSASKTIDYDHGVSLRLDGDVRICDIEVVTSDVGAGMARSGGSFFPPSVSVLATAPAAQVGLSRQPRSTLAQRVAAVPGLSNAELRVADAAAMAATLQSLWAAMKNRPVEELAAGEIHQDGTPRISSQVSVWLIGRISEAYGRRKLVKLSRVKDVEALRSLGGLTELLMSAIDADTKGTWA